MANAVKGGVNRTGVRPRRSGHSEGKTIPNNEGLKKGGNHDLKESIESFTEEVSATEKRETS